MLIKEAFNKGTELLKDAGIDAPVNDTGIILCYTLKKDRSFLYAHEDYPLEKEEYRKFFGYLSKRVRHVPLQYITGHCEFMSLDFDVNPSVLIPRQDTELLVETVISFVQNSNEYRIVKPQKLNSDLHILEIGTGSGCIAVSLAYYLKNSRVTAVDISSDALAVALKNAKRAGVEKRIEFILSNIYTELDGSKFDIIVSNPPYIPTGQISLLQAEVSQYEPLTALDGGSDGLAYYKFIIKDSVRYLKTSGLIALEVGIGQAGQVRALMQDKYEDITALKDLQGIERVLAGRLISQNKASLL